VEFKQVIDLEKRYDPRRSEMRPEIFDGVSVRGKSIVEKTKEGTMAFYERNEGLSNENSNATLWLWQRFLLFNTEYPNIVYHISSG
jgi:hypothetical protein